MSANPSRLGLKVLLALVVVGGVAAAAWVSFRPVAQVVAVKADLAQDIVSGAVVVTPEKTSELKSEADGRLVESDLAVGKIVRAGDVLARIDSADIENNIRHIRSELEAQKETNKVNEAKAALAWKTVEEDFEENKRLHGLGRLADVPFTRLERDFASKKQEQELAKVANAQKVEALEHELATLELQKQKTIVVAPFDGVIAQVFAHKGDLIVNKQALASLITVSRIVTGKISEERFAAIKEGQKGLVKFLTYGDGTFTATVKKKLPTAEEATQRYLVYLDVVIPPEKLLPNLTGDLAVVVDEHQAQALVPRRAVREGSYVYVVTNGRVTRRPVKLGFTSLTMAEVTEGLRAGELVIVEETEKFADGDRVRTEMAK